MKEPHPTLQILLLEVTVNMIALPTNIFLVLCSAKLTEALRRTLRCASRFKKGWGRGSARSDCDLLWRRLDPLVFSRIRAKRVPLIRGTLERIAANVRQMRISGSYYYDWGDKPIEYAVWRRGGLTEGGKVLFGR